MKSLCVALILLLSVQFSYSRDDCHQNLTATFNLQFITSPQWPDTYPFNLSCVWVIRGIPNYRIRVNFTHIDLESHVDFVEIFEDEIKKMEYTGSQLPRPYISSGSIIKLHFISDYSVSFHGFRASYSMMSSSSTSTNINTTDPEQLQNCGYKAYATTFPQNLTSPLWPSLYPSNSNCYWTITQTPGNRGIYLQFHLLNTELEHDRLLIIENGEVIHNFSGDQILSSYQTTAKTLTLRFISDDVLVSQGFRLTYSALSSIEVVSTAPSLINSVEVTSSTDQRVISNACRTVHLNATENAQLLFSPNRPFVYPNNANCTWIIRSPIGSGIVLDFKLFYIEKDYDFFYIFENDLLVENFTGNLSLPLYFSNRSILVMTFVSDEHLKGDGFEISYKTYSLPEESSSTSFNLTTENNSNQFCEPDRFRQYGKWFRFNRVGLFEQALSRDICPQTGRPLATIICEKQSIDGGPPSVGFNINTLFAVPCNLHLLNLTSQSENMLEKMSVLTSNTTLITHQHYLTSIDAFSLHLKRIEATKRSYYEILNGIQILENLLTAVNKNLASQSKVLEKHISFMLTSLRRLVLSVIIPSYSNTIPFRTSCVDLQVINLESLLSEDPSITDIIFGLNAGEHVGNVAITVLTRSISNTSFSTNFNILFAMLLEKEIFLNNKYKVFQIVSIGSNKEFTNLPFTMKFNVPGEKMNKTDLTKTLRNKTDLAKWNYETDEWIVEKDCEEVEDLTFKCSSSGTYALVYEVNNNRPYLTKVVIVQTACAVSSIILFFILLFYLTRRKLRQKPMSRNLMNACLCQSVVYAFYAMATEFAEHDILCTAITAVLHFSVLACLLWKSVGACQSYKAFKKMKYNKRGNNCLTYLLAYGLPLLVVILNFVSTEVILKPQSTIHQNISFNSLYRENFSCWLRPPSLYWGFLFPAGLLLLYNCAIFAFLLPKIASRRNKGSRQKTIQYNYMKLISSLILIVTTWILGYFFLLSANTSYNYFMEYILAALILVQSAAMFFLYCIFPFYTAKIWAPCVYKRSVSIKSNNGLDGKFIKASKQSTSSSSAA